MTARRTTDPQALAARLGARAFGDEARWWTVAEIAAHYGYEPQSVRDWMRERDYAADLPRSRGRNNRVLIWCEAPPAPPPDARRGRDTAGRARIVAAVRAAGGPPGPVGRGCTFWRDIAAQCGTTPARAQLRYLWAKRLGEVK